MLTVTIDQSEGISGADIPEQAVKKMRTGSAALSLPSPRAFFAFFFLKDFSPLFRSLEQARSNGAAELHILVDLLCHTTAAELHNSVNLLCGTTGAELNPV